MRIDSGLNGHYYGGRLYEIEQKTSEAQDDDAPVTRKPLPSAMTGSDALLSKSLANAIWQMERSRFSADNESRSMSRDEKNAERTSRIQDLYLEYAELA